jgi:hypothetical protein
MRLLKSGESGQAMIMALILLAVGGLLIVPTLNLTSTSLNYHRMVEENTQELCAADSGMQYALSKFANNPVAFGSEPLPEEVNDRTVSVTAEHVIDNVFKITSTATSDDGSSTTIESYVMLSADYSYLFDNAITSPGDVTLKPGTIVYGDIQLNGDLDNRGDIYGEISEDPIDWPTAEDFCDFYLDDVDELTPLPDGYVINISGGTEADPYLIGPLYAGGSLTITGNGVARLEGTVYVIGNFLLKPNSTLIFNRQTIFSEGSIQLQPGCIVSGSGCIIAIGSIDYQPNIIGDDFVFLMSLEGPVTLKPGNSFYGSIGGEAEVELMPHVTLNWVEPDGELNFLGGGGGGSGIGGLDIITWQISK